jgi:murein DD-endopeptidase MepM/ murein hydrolase activator NlpD
LSVQPHDWASQIEQVPVLDDPQPFIKRRRPRLSLFLFHRQRSAAQQAWSVLDHVKHRTDAPSLAPQPAPRPALKIRLRQALQRTPRRFIGHGVVLALVLAVIGSGGLPALALEMDWTQGATVATDHVAEVEELEQHAGATAPVVIAGAQSGSRRASNEQQDSLVPSLLPRPTVAVSVFIATHTVASGEKLGQIAAQYNVSVMSVVAANGINPQLLAIGQELRIPSVSGVPHKVAEGETVESIAALYTIPSSTIRFFPANNLSSGRAVQPGEEIFIPGGTAIGSGPSEAEAAEATAVPVATVLDDETRMRSGPSTDYERIAKLAANTAVILVGRHENWFKIRTQNGTEGWIAADLLGVEDGVADGVAVITDIPALPAAEAAPPEPEAPAPAPPKPANRWVWPTAGDLTSGFGYRSFKVGQFHNGIDIANRKGTPIRAARAGRVIEAGWCSGYGYCVKINHGDGFVTEYGHMATRPSVSVGEYVNAGDRIGSMGSTYDRKGGGYSTGVHLHFTVKLGGKAVNPMRYLP